MWGAQNLNKYKENAICVNYEDIMNASVQTAREICKRPLVYIFQWQPTPVFLPGESQGRGSLVGCRLWGRTELDTTEVT